MNPDQETIGSADACFQRGLLLRAQQRHVDAASMFKKALEADANHAASYAMLALCWMRDEETAGKAVDAARRGVTLEPEDAFHHSVLAMAISSTAKPGQNGILKEALAAAEKAVELDAYSPVSHSVKASLLLQLGKFAEAEASAREALAIDTESEQATEVLSIALLRQHKDEDNAGLVRYQLETRPDDDSSHTSAGWLALKQGNHKEANRHFSEALRLNPMNDFARMGLVESYRARSIVYSSFVRFATAMDRFSGGRQTAIMIGGFIAYRILGSYLSKVAPFWAFVLIAAWLLLALWSHLARGFGSFFMVLDPSARRALKPKEFWEGVVVGGSTLLAFGCLLLSFKLGRAAGEGALAVFFSAAVSAAAFTNDHHLGKYIYAGAAVVAGFGAMVVLVAMLSPTRFPFEALFLLITVYTGVAVSWLRPLRVLYA